MLQRSRRGLLERGQTIATTRRGRLECSQTVARPRRGALEWTNHRKASTRSVGPQSCHASRKAGSRPQSAALRREAEWGHGELILFALQAGRNGLNALDFSGPVAGYLRQNDTMDQTILAKASTIARGLSLDAVNQAKSGHLGLPLGATEIGAVLFGHDLNYHPSTPKWINRDRFVLSAGHGSNVPLQLAAPGGIRHFIGRCPELPAAPFQNARAPRVGETDGVEATTGPLGQGIGNAVGYALSGKMAAVKFNTPEHAIFITT